MLLSEYQAQLAEIIGRYAQTDLIVASELNVDARTPKLGVIKGVLIFADGARLLFTEYVDTRYRLEKLTYSYHYQDSNARLLFRYDNAAHKPALSYSCHKHIANGKIIEVSDPDLSSVLDEALEQFVRWEGKEREIGVSPETYARLEKEFADGARLEFDKEAYRADLKGAAAKTGQEYEGSHGLRWSWAQERHAELQERGMTYEQSLSVVSQEMGHERGDITEHYLR